MLRYNWDHNFWHDYKWNHDEFCSETCLLRQAENSMLSPVRLPASDILPTREKQMPLIKFKSMCSMTAENIEIVVGIFHNNDFCFWYKELEDEKDKFVLIVVIPEKGYIHEITTDFYSPTARKIAVAHCDELNQYLRLMNPEEAKKFYAKTISKSLTQNTNYDDD